MMTTENAIITDIRLIQEDHGLLCLNIDLKMECNRVTFGGYCIGRACYPDSNLSETDNGNYAAYYIAKVMDVLGITRLDSAKNMPVRVIYEDEKQITCIGIQNFLDSSKVFIPKAMDNESIDETEIMSACGKFKYKSEKEGRNLC